MNILVCLVIECYYFVISCYLVEGGGGGGGGGGGRRDVMGMSFFYSSFPSHLDYAIFFRVSVLVYISE